MTNEQLKALEEKLWASANSLRAYGGLKSADYAVPVLGLIFLKFADNKYSQHETEILATYAKEKGTRMEREIEKVAISICGFYLPKTARYEHLLRLPEGESLAKALKKAMEDIEASQDAKFQDILPKDAYFDIEKKKDDILPQLLKDFSDIPEDASGDVFGKIYEYFLGKFALSEGQKGGQFFTPTSVVRFIVEVIEPYKGKVYDPACGSGGMFVQSANFIREANRSLTDIYVHGQEFVGETVRLAKMNLLVNNLRGEIAEVNSYDSDPYDSYGKFDYVMANPPFNVKSVKEGTVKGDKRFYEYGLPKSKDKKDDKISDANYLWVSLFATSLNETGRAGFVMANSTSDARGSEYEIRKKIVDSGIVDCMVSMPSNMFFTVTLPATLWFFDKEKVHTDRKDRILFIDARNVYNQIDRAHREWTESQIQNLSAIVRLHRGETERYLELVANYLNNADEASQKIAPVQKKLEEELERVSNQLKSYVKTNPKLTPAKKKTLEEANFFARLEAFKLPLAKELLATAIANAPLNNQSQHEAAEKLGVYCDQLKEVSQSLKSLADQLIELWKLADKNLKGKADKVWAEHLNRSDRELEALLAEMTKAKDSVLGWHENINWLQSRFPNAEYEDVVGLCKSADKDEYAEEQGYSLNAGRYVGVYIPEDDVTEEEFIKELENKTNEFKALSEEASALERQITEFNQVVHG